LFLFKNINEYQAALLAGEQSCVQAVQYYLDQINKHQDLNAFIEVFAEDALARAKTLDQVSQKNQLVGTLHGVVIGIKDVLCYKDHQVSAASHILENYTAIYSATAIEKLLAEGAIIIGRQN
jgi:aspartyl-tRNA(Asn)/glutamyl-tRNA(Gln) amidotransferase subunit A